VKKTLVSKTDVISVLLCLLAILPGLIVYRKLPERIPTHFGLDGEPDGYSSRAFAVFLIPVLIAAMQALFCVVTRCIRKEEKDGKADRVVKMIMPTLAITLQMIILLYAMKKLTDITSVFGILVTLLIMVLGNYLPKVRRNAFYGIRTPHTLANQELWDRTHRFAGLFSFLTGVFCMIVTVMELPFSLMLVAIAIYVGVPFLYSEILYRRMKKKTQEEEE